MDVGAINVMQGNVTVLQLCVGKAGVERHSTHIHKDPST